MATCTTCGGTRTMTPMRAQSNMSMGKSPDPRGAISGSNLVATRPVSPMSTKTMNPLHNPHMSMSRMGPDGNKATNTSPFPDRSKPSLGMSASYGSSNYAGQSFKTSGATGNMSKYVGRGR